MKVNFKIVALITTLVMLTLAACSNSALSSSDATPSSQSETIPPPSQSESTPKPSNQNTQESEYTSIYIQVFESYFDIDPALHEEMEYLAIDMDSLTNTTDDDKKVIAAHFADKLNIEIIDMSFDELNEQGFVGEMNQIDGLLLYINNLDVTKNTITVEGTKFKSGLGANFIKSILKKDGNKWVLESSDVWAMA